MKRWTSLGTASLLVAMVSGCTYTTLDGRVTITTKPQSNLTIPPNAKPVTGSSCTRVVLLLIPVGLATAEAAYDDALAQVPGADTLLNYEARTDVAAVLPFYYQVCANIHGYAVSSQQLVSQADHPSEARSYVSFWQESWRNRPTEGSYKPHPIAPPTSSSN